MCACLCVHKKKSVCTLRQKKSVYSPSEKECVFSVRKRVYFTGSFIFSCSSSSSLCQTGAVSITHSALKGVCVCVCVYMCVCVYVITDEVMYFCTPIAFMCAVHCLSYIYGLTCITSTPVCCSVYRNGFMFGFECLVVF